MFDEIIFYFHYFGSIFMPELLVCCAAFCYHYERRKLFVPRVFAAVTAYVLYCVFSSSMFIPVPYESAAAPLVHFVYFVLDWAVILCGMAFCFKLNFRTVLFAGCGGYAVQHAAYCISNILVYTSGITVTRYTSMIFEFPITAAVAVAAVFGTRKMRDFTVKKNSLKFLVTVAGTLASCVLLSAYINWFARLHSETALFLRLTGKCSALLFCLLLIIVMFNMVLENNQQRENELMEAVLSAEREQHKLQKESIDIINIKCHDLKHHISEFSGGDYNGDLEEIERAVGIYDSGLVTGNDTLDFVLTQKSLRCERQGVTLTCIADGRRLSCMHKSDILSLLGNALDNAIEAVSHMSKDKRLISLKIGGQNGNVFIHIENSCESGVTFEGGLPQTTKTDKAYHGFGVRSIRYIVKKYGGELNMYVEDGKFNIDVLLPDMKKNAS